MQYRKNLNWNEHQLDPDNWLQIPEFNVLPKDVDFQGFKYPIFGPTITSEIVLPIWHLVTGVRREARSRFKSLAEMNAIGENMLKGHDKLTKDELFVTRYVCFFGDIKRCLLSYRKDKTRSMYALAWASSEATAMFLERPVSKQEVDDIRSGIGRNAALLRHATDPKQADKAMVKECWSDWQKQPDRYDGKAAFARDMRDKFENLKSQPVIEGWCRAWECEA